MKPSCKFCLRECRKYKPDGQKFKSGDKVFITKDLGPSMDHFPSNIKAVIVSSYYQQYEVCINGSHVSWYYEHQLTLVR